MKQFIAFLVLSLFIFIACKKNTSAPVIPPNTLTASVNGTPMSFNIALTVDSTSTPGTIYLVGHSDSANLTPLMEVTITGNQGQIGYTAWSNDTAIQYVGSGDSVSVTSTKTTLSGTFSGTCYYTLDSMVLITNGKYSISLQRP